MLIVVFRRMFVCIAFVLGYYMCYVYVMCLLCVMCYFLSYVLICLETARRNYCIVYLIVVYIR